MVFPATYRDVVTEIFVNSDWVDISSDLYRRDPVVINHGRPDEGTQEQTSRCTFTLDNRSGKYTLRNPMGTYYPSLGTNTPVRIGLRETYATFGTPVASSWGNTDTGIAFAQFGAGSVLASDWNVAAGVGTHSVSVVNAYRNSYFAALPFGDIEMAVTLTMGITNITGGALEPANIWFKGNTSNDGFLVRMCIETDERITLDLVTPSGSSFLPGTITVPGLTHSAAQSLRIRAHIEGSTIRAKVWAVGTPEPYGWVLQWSDPSFGVLAPGWVGVRSGVSVGNTNALPIVFSYDNLVVKRLRYTGELAQLPADRDVTSQDKYVNATANGILRRLGSGEVLQSAMRRGVLSVNPVAYWPCEEDSDATIISSGLGAGNEMTSLLVPPSFASNNDFACSNALPTLNSVALFGNIPAYDTSTNQLQVRFLVSIPVGGATNGELLLRMWTTGGTTGFWDVRYGTGGTLTINIFDPAGALLHTSGAIGFALNGAPLRLSLELTQNGANIDWNLSTLTVTGVAGGISNTLAGRTFVRGDWINVGGDRTFTNVAVGHITVQNVVTNIFALAEQLRAYEGEKAGTRLVRLCAENSIILSTIGTMSDTAAMGPQRPAALLPLITDCVKADIGWLTESRGVVGLTYRTRTANYAVAATATLTYSNRELASPFKPMDDDQLTRNDWTVNRSDGVVKGGSYRATLATGRMSTLDPALGGSGRYDDTYTVNLETDGQLRDVAGWKLLLGTVDESRFPEVNVNLANARIAANATLASALLDLNVNDRVVITGAAASTFIYDDISQLVCGYQETFTQDQHALVWNCQPASPFAVLTLDTTRLDSSSTVLDRAATTGATALYIRSTAEIWTTAAGDLPLDIKINGERMTVTAITSATPTLVATGAADHQNNASVSPGLPAGHALNDLLLIFAAIRNSGAGVPVAPAGYTTLVVFGNMALFGKIDNGAEGTPTVTFTGGVANATTSAQMAAFRYASLTASSVASALLNGSAQDIILPLRTNRERGNVLLIQMGWKQDDWTSVAALSGSTEIGDTSSLTGDDQGIVWDFRAETGGGTDIPATSFVVTGGAAAISRGMTYPLWAVQQLTVTRAVNGVAKAPAAGSVVNVFQPPTLGL